MRKTPSLHWAAYADSDLWFLILFPFFLLYFCAILFGLVDQIQDALLTYRPTQFAFGAIPVGPLSFHCSRRLAQSKGVAGAKTANGTPSTARSFAS